MNSSLKETLALLKRDAWVKPYLGHYRKILALALVLGCCTVLFAAGLMFTSGWLIAGSAEMPYSVLMLGTPLLCVRVFGATANAWQATIGCCDSPRTFASNYTGLLMQKVFSFALATALETPWGFWLKTLSISKTSIFVAFSQLQ